MNHRSRRTYYLLEEMQMVTCKDPCNPTIDEIKQCLADPDCQRFCEANCPQAKQALSKGAAAIDWGSLFALATALIQTVLQWLAQPQPTPAPTP